MITSTTVYTVVSRLLEAVEMGLRVAGTPVEIASIYPAAIAWDQCDCGTLALAVQRQYVTSDFPALDESTQLPCNGGFIGVDLVIQVLRCASQPMSEVSLTPAISALDETAQLILSDAWVVLSAVQCVLPDLFDENLIIGYVLLPQMFAGPSGGCVGSVLAVTFGVEQS